MDQQHCLCIFTLHVKGATLQSKYLKLNHITYDAISGHFSLSTAFKESILMAVFSSAITCPNWNLLCQYVQYDSLFCYNLHSWQSNYSFPSAPRCWKPPPLHLNENTKADVVLAGFLVWLSWCVPHFTCTGVSSRCVGANRVRATDSGVETFINIWGRNSQYSCC